jgi:hypothetical protein
VELLTAKNLIEKIEKHLEDNLNIYFASRVSGNKFKVESLENYRVFFSNGRYIDLLDDVIESIDFTFSYDNVLTWMDAKKQRLLYTNICSLSPCDKMFSDSGYLYPTRIYTATRTQATTKIVPILYDINYILDYYNSRVINLLSPHNQASLILKILKQYLSGQDSLDVFSSRGFRDYFVKLLHELTSEYDRTGIANTLARTVGKRLVPLNKTKK